MRPLDVAYKLGADAATRDFVYAVKEAQTPVPLPAQPNAPPSPLTPPPKPTPALPLGAAPAVKGASLASDFTTWADDAAYDNPTAPLPKFASSIAVAKVLEKLGAPRRKKRAPASRPPVGSGGRFQSLKKKLAKGKGRSQRSATRK